MFLVTVSVFLTDKLFVIVYNYVNASLKMNELWFYIYDKVGRWSILMSNWRNSKVDNRNFSGTTLQMTGRER